MLIRGLKSILGMLLYHSCLTRMQHQGHWESRVAEVVFAYILANTKMSTVALAGRDLARAAGSQN